MKKYHIENCGCDDTTEFDIELTDEELATAIKIFEANNKEASYGCMPDIRIYNYSEDTFDYCNDKNMLNKTYDELNGIEVIK